MGLRVVHEDEARLLAGDGVVGAVASGDAGFRILVAGDDAVFECPVHSTRVPNIVQDVGKAGLICGLVGIAGGCALGVGEAPEHHGHLSAGKLAVGEKRRVVYALDETRILAELERAVLHVPVGRDDVLVAELIGLVVDDEAAGCFSGVGARAANGEGGGADLLVVLVLHVAIFALKLGSVGGVDLHRRDVFAGVCLIVHDDGAVVDARRRGRVLSVDDEVHVHEVVEVEGSSAALEAHGHATDLVFVRVTDVGVLRVVARARVAVGVTVDELVVGALDERVSLVRDFRDGRLNRRAGVVEHGGAVLERDSLVVPLEVFAAPHHVLDVDVGHKACRRDLEQALGFACVGSR